MSHTRIEKKEETYTLTVGDRGRLVLPASVRKKLGLEKGDRVSLAVKPGGEMRLISRREAIKRLEGMHEDLVSSGGSLVDELIAERREEARRESEL